MKQFQKIYKRNIKLGISNKRENCHWIARVFLNSYNDFILLKFEIFAEARTLEYIDQMTHSDKFSYSDKPEGSDNLISR